MGAIFLMKFFFHYESKFWWSKIKFHLRELRKLFLQFLTLLAAYLVNTVLQIFFENLNSNYLHGLNIVVFVDLILLCGHIEKNQGPKAKSNNNLSSNDKTNISYPLIRTRTWAYQG